MCGEVIWPGANEHICVAPAGHAKDGHNFFPRDCVHVEVTSTTVTSGATPNEEHEMPYMFEGWEVKGAEISAYITIVCIALATLIYVCFYLLP